MSTKGKFKKGKGQKVNFYKEEKRSTLTKIKNRMNKFYNNVKNRNKPKSMAQLFELTTPVL